MTWGNQSKCMFCGIESTEKGTRLMKSCHYCASNTAIFWLCSITVTQAPPISMTSKHQQSCESITNTDSQSSSKKSLSFNRTKSTEWALSWRVSSIMKKRTCIIVSHFTTFTFNSPLLPCECSCLTCHRWLSVVLHGTKMFILIYLILFQRV